MLKIITKPSNDWLNLSTEHKIVNNEIKTLRKVVVHKFKVGDIEDPDLHAAHPLWEWEHSEMGQWVMRHAVETPMWQRFNNYQSYHTEYAIVATLEDKDYTFWQLKWSNGS